MHYKAQIEFSAYVDDYEQGQQLDRVNTWDETIMAYTQEELRNKVLQSTYSKWEDLSDEQINEYEWCTEYHTSYIAINDSQLGLVTPSDFEIDEWKKGKEKLYAVNCHILVSKITEEKATL